MSLDRPRPLGASIVVTGKNRPIKIAYLVPYEESSRSHQILDAVFYESYTRWAGGYTLILPATSSEFLDAKYEEWLSFFDPDFVYSFLDLEHNFIQAINNACWPIAFLKHRARGSHPDMWRNYVPEFGHYFQPVSSMTTIPSPQVHRLPAIYSGDEQPITVATIHDPDPSENRRFTDNFGTNFRRGTVTHEIPGLFRTLCLTPENLPKNHITGSERCESMSAMLSAIANGKAAPIAKFAMAHAEAIPKLYAYPWSDSFHVFVGTSLRDRIHFWNARHFIPSYATNSLGCLIYDAPFFSDPSLLEMLGQFLNRRNFLGQSNSPARVTIRSYSHDKNNLLELAKALQKHTYNSVSVDERFNLAPLPEKQIFENADFGDWSNTFTFKMTENFMELTADQPHHFSYIPVRLKGLSKGQWIVELDIQRHNNQSKYSNPDTWVLPRRRKVVRAFTNNLAKVTCNHKLAVLTVSKDFPFSDRQEPNLYTLSLPDDEEFFRFLLLDFFKYPTDDLRSFDKGGAYEKLTISDKGQNLRGVISLFHRLSDAYELLTNKYWRQVLRGSKEDGVRRLVFTREQLEGYLPNDRPSKEKLKEELRLPDLQAVARYMNNALTDSLEYLVRACVFYCIHQWRCTYCGHTNTRIFDSMTIKNECEICNTQYLAPIDLEWTYQLNEFVFRSLVKHTGLPVLWTLGRLQDQSWKSFWYLPEVDLYTESRTPDKKEEIDILCVFEGKFVAVEAKLSAVQITRPEAWNRYVEKINRIKPDIAILSFEQYSDGNDFESVKAALKETVSNIRDRLAPGIQLKTIIASDLPGFNDHPQDLGYIGPRSSRE